MTCLEQIKQKYEEWSALPRGCGDDNYSEGYCDGREEAYEELITLLEKKVNKDDNNTPIKYRGA
jgi:hypothetical protein